MKMGGVQLVCVLVAVGSGALSVPLRERSQQLSADPLFPGAGAGTSGSVVSPLPMAHAPSNDSTAVTGAGGQTSSGQGNRAVRQNSECCGADVTSTASPVKRDIGSGEQLSALDTCCGLESRESCCGASLQQDTPDTGSGKTKRDSGCCGLEGGDHATCCGLEKNETFCCGKQRIARSERGESSYDHPDNVATRMARDTNLGEAAPCCGSEDSTKTPNPEKPKRSTCCGSPVDEPPVDTVPETITKEKRETCCGLEENESNKCCGLHDTGAATTPAQKVKRCPQTSTATPV